MANEVELENLVVRLTGDANQYLKMLKDAAEHTRRTTQEVEKQATRIEKFQQGLEKFGASAVSVFKSIGITAVAMKAFEKFDDAEDAAKRLDFVLGANNRNVAESREEYQKFAKEMAKTSEYSKGLTLSMLEQATQLRLTNEQAKNAVKNAMTLGAMKQSDPQSFLRQTVGFEKTGNASGIARVLGLIGEMEEGTDKAAQVTEMLAANWGLVAVQGENGSAKIGRALASVNSITKAIGEQVATVVGPAIDLIEKVGEKFEKIPGPIKSAVVAFGLLVAVIEPLLIAWTFASARVAALGAALTKLADVALATAMKMWALSDSFAAMSAKAKVATIAVTALTVVIAAAAIASYVALSRAVEQANAAVQRHGDLTDKQLQRERQRQESVKSQLDRAGGDSATRARIAEANLPEAEKRMLELEAQLNAAKKRTEEKDTSTGVIKGGFRIGRGVPLLGSGAQAEYESAKAQEEAVRKLYENQKEYVESLQKSKFVSQQSLDAADDLVQKYKDQAATAGMTAAEIERYNMAKALGDDHYLLGVIRENQELAEQAKKVADANEQMRKYNDDLKFQADTFGMTAEAARLHKASLDGVDESLIRQSKALSDALQAEKDYFDMMKEGEDLMREFQSPLDKFEEGFDHLTDLFLNGAIDLDTYNAAVDRQAKSYEDATRGAEEASSAIQRLDSVLAGGAEARSRIFSYSTSMRLGQEDTVAKRNDSPFAALAARNKEMVDQQRRTNALLEKIADNPGVDFEGADL